MHDQEIDTMIKVEVARFMKPGNSLQERDINALDSKINAAV
jgi:hypothetical protein